LLVRRRVREGSLSWQFPAGECEPGEEPFTTAAREVMEEVGLTVTPSILIGARDHPATGRHMIYVGCTADTDTATLVDDEELAELAWCDWSGLHAKIPNGLFDPVQVYLRQSLRDSE
jgi:8-oxo-dGTP diphosphatase